MRTIVGLSLLASLALAPVAAHAESEGRRDGSRLWDRMCSGETGARTMTGAADDLGRRLSLTDAQKGLLKDLSDARQKARDDAKAALCGQRPDFSNMLARYDFRTRFLETRLAAMKAVRPKLDAFFNALDDKQKSSVDDAVRQMWREHFDRRHDEDRGREYGRDDDRRDYGGRGGYRDDDRYGDRRPRGDRWRGEDDMGGGGDDRHFGYRHRGDDGYGWRRGRDWDRRDYDRDERDHDRRGPAPDHDEE